MTDQRPTPETPTVHQTPERGIVRPILKPGTYRLPGDAHDIITTEVAAQAAKGNRVSQAEVITHALRHTYRPEPPERP